MAIHQAFQLPTLYGSDGLGSYHIQKDNRNGSLFHPSKSSMDLYSQKPSPKSVLSNLIFGGTRDGVSFEENFNPPIMTAGSDPPADEIMALPGPLMPVQIIKTTMPHGFPTLGLWCCRFDVCCQGSNPLHFLLLLITHPRPANSGVHCESGPDEGFCQSIYFSSTYP